MMRQSGARWAAFSLTAGALLGAAPVRADTPARTLIWYRSAEGCPDGAGFLERLEARGVHGRLAGVGDPIDFVVTLGSGAEGARGLLERQTKTGTVAIRQLDGGSCEEVADGVALSLALADVPAEHREAPPVAAPSAVEAQKPPEPIPGTSGNDARGAMRPAAPAQGARAARWAIGLQGSVASGIAPGPLPGGALFVDFAPSSPSLLVGSSLRLSGFGGARGSSGGGQGYGLWLVGGRLDACPTRLGSPTLHVSPCASVEVGALLSSDFGSKWYDRSMGEQGLCACGCTPCARCKLEDERALRITPDRLGCDCTQVVVPPAGAGGSDPGGDRCVPFCVFRNTQRATCPGL
jgi:hypothetical protein